MLMMLTSNASWFKLDDKSNMKENKKKATKKKQTKTARCPSRYERWTGVLPLFFSFFSR